MLGNILAVDVINHFHLIATLLRSIANTHSPLWPHVLCQRRCDCHAVSRVASNCPRSGMCLRPIAHKSCSDRVTFGFGLNCAYMWRRGLDSVVLPGVASCAAAVETGTHFLILLLTTYLLFLLWLIAADYFIVAVWQTVLCCLSVNSNVFTKCSKLS